MSIGSAGGRKQFILSKGSSDITSKIGGYTSHFGKKLRVVQSFAVLKMLQVVENESLRLANRVAIGYPLARWDTL